MFLTFVVNQTLCICQNLLPWQLLTCVKCVQILNLSKHTTFVTLLLIHLNKSIVFVLNVFAFKLIIFKYYICMCCSSCYCVWLFSDRSFAQFLFGHDYMMTPHNLFPTIYKSFTDERIVLYTKDTNDYFVKQIRHLSVGVVIAIFHLMSI